MTPPPVVAVLGASGAVGRAAARFLHEQGCLLRLGGRRWAAVDAVNRDQGGGHEPVVVDLWDPDSLAGFCANATVVLNCAGPSYRVLDRVALAAVDAGANYVDPGGDTPVYNRLTDVHLVGRGRTAVLNAGLMPGLTAVLPRWLSAGHPGAPTRLEAHVGLVDEFTPVGAAEYLLTLAGEHGEAQAAWRRGARRSHCLAPRSDVALFPFPGRVNVQPYLSHETERTARELRLGDVDWFNVFAGRGHVAAALSRLQWATAGEGHLGAAADELRTASRLDLFGEDPYQLMTLVLQDDTGRCLSSVVRSRDTYEVTAAVAAHATAEVLAGSVRPGLHFLEHAVDVERLVEELRSRAVLQVSTTMDALPSPTGTRAGAEVEGEL